MIIMEEENILYGPKLTFDYYSKYGSLGKLILENLKLYSNAVCLIDAVTKEKLTYNEILHKTIQTAETLKHIGITKNDVLAISSENHINFFIPVIAAIYLGIPVAPINHSYAKAELIHAVNISKPKIIFCSSKIIDNFLEIRDKIPYVQRMITLESYVKINGGENLQDFLKILPTVKYTNTFKIEEFDPKEKLAFILTSSGTTGLPKGVALTHYNFLIELSILDEPSLNQKAYKSTLAVLPLFHSYGLTHILGSINRGTTVIILNRFHVETFLKAIEEFKISRVSLVPPILVALSKSPLVNKYDLSSMKEINVGAAPLGVGIEESIKKRFHIKDVLQGYGLTETTLGMTKTPAGKSRTGASGLLVPCMQAKVCDTETGKSLGVRERGELCFRGPLIMKGYYENPEATKQIIDSNGWLHTGDIGYYDEDGYFYIVDRIKELIKFKGFQVAPAELEYLLMNHPSIKDAAVIGKTDENAGELPLAFVVKEDAVKISAADIQLYIAKQVSPQKRLHGGVVFVKEIPKNPSGKILRRKLRETFNEKSKL